MDKLSPKQEQAAMLLAMGRSGKDVADTVGVTPETICTWKRDAVFEATINRQKLELFFSIRDRFRLTTNKALIALEDIIDNPSSDIVKLRACVELLKLTEFKEPIFLVSGIGESTLEKGN